MQNTFPGRKYRIWLLDRYIFLAEFLYFIRTEQIANNRHATENSRVRSAILLSVCLKISLCPKYSVWSPSCIPSSWNLCNLTFLSGFPDMLCVSFLMFLLIYLSYISFFMPQNIHLHPCTRMTSQPIGELQISVPTTNTYKTGKYS